MLKNLILYVYVGLTINLKWYMIIFFLANHFKLPKIPHGVSFFGFASLGIGYLFNKRNRDRIRSQEDRLNSRFDRLEQQQSTIQSNQESLREQQARLQD